MRNHQELNILQKYLNSTKTHYNSKKLQETVLSSPHEGLVNISDSLDLMRIVYSVLDFSEDKFTPEHLPDKFLTTITQNDASFTCLVNAEGKEISILYPNGYYEKNVKLDYLIQYWDGICIVIERKKHRISKKNIVAIIALIATSYFFITQSLSLSVYSSLVFWLGGASLFVAVAIVATEYNVNFAKIVENVCKVSEVNNNRLDCSTLINKHGKLFTGWLNVSDLLLVFQLTFFITFLLCKDVGICLILDLASIPFIVFTLIKQFRLRLWCKLCLIVTVLTISRLVVYYILQVSINETSLLDNLYLVLLVALLILVIWLLVRWILFIQSDRQTKAIELKTFQRDISLFNSYLLNSHDTLEVATDETFFIQKHPNIQLENDVTFIISPFCSHCLEIVTRLTFSQIDNFNVRILLSVKFNEIDPTPSQLVGEALIGIYLIKGWDAFLSAYLNLHKSTNKRKWFDNNKQFLSEVTNDILVVQNSILRSNRISISPLAFFQGRLVKAPYKTTDVINFLY